MQTKSEPAESRTTGETDESHMEAYGRLLEEVRKDIRKDTEAFDRPHLTSGFRLYESPTPLLLYTMMLLILVAGCIVAFVTNEPTWLNRFSGLVIVLGVASAYLTFRHLKLHSQLHGRLPAYLRDPDYRERRVYKIKRANPNYDDQDVEHALATNEEKAIKTSKVALQYMERHLLSSEIIIVCIGTILNNFGDKLIGKAVRYINSL